jgi:hypothetical protein
MKDEDVGPCSVHDAFILHTSSFIPSSEGILLKVVTLKEAEVSAYARG